MGGPSIVSPTLVLAIVLMAPTAAADWLELTSSESVAMSGTFEATAPEGRARFSAPAGSAPASLVVQSGTATLWSWTRTETPLGYVQNGDAEPTSFTLANATIVLDVGRGADSQVLTHPGGALTVRASVDEAGRPVRLPASVPSRVETNPFRSADMARVDLEQGWLVVGKLMREAITGYPQVPVGELGIAGPAKIHFHGGIARFADASGVPRELDLHEVVTRDTPVGREIAMRRLVIEGDFASATLPLSEGWGMAAPDMEWRLDGTATWTGASGTAERGGRETTFEGTTVEIAITGPIRSRDTVPATTYTAAGRFHELRVGGETVTAPPATASAAPVALGLGALLLLALTAWGQRALGVGAAALYTRLQPGELLDHPRRRAIHEIVTSEPGIHQRELHRRVGGAWGAFTFHLGMLTRSGHLRAATQGGYTVLFPAGSPILPEQTIPAGIARDLYAALPSDGAPVLLQDLSARLAASPELVRYHVRALEKRNLVKRVYTDDSRRAVARLATALE